MMLCFLPQRTPLTGFIRVFTTSLTSQQGEKLQYSHQQTETCGHGLRREGRGREFFFTHWALKPPRITRKARLSPRILFFKVLWQWPHWHSFNAVGASKLSVCCCFFYTPFFPITLCHRHNHPLYLRRFPTCVPTWHHNFSRANSAEL